MSPVILPPPVRITKEQAEMFFRAIAKALLNLPIEDLEQVYLFHDQSVVISYSGNYQPFIGYTMSYNDPDSRIFINQDTYVLKRIGEALDLQGRDIPGGRVFIESEYAYIKNFEYNRNVILLLDWQDHDVYKATKAVYNLIRNSVLSN